MSDERRVGTISRGIRCPIIREGDDLAAIVVDSVCEAAQTEGFEFNDRDVISITESIVARAQGNYANTDQIAADIGEGFRFSSHIAGILIRHDHFQRTGGCLCAGGQRHGQRADGLLRLAQNRRLPDAQRLCAHA